MIPTEDLTDVSDDHDDQDDHDDHIDQDNHDYQWLWKSKHLKGRSGLPVCESVSP